MINYNPNSLIILFGKLAYYFLLPFIYMYV